MEPSEEKAASPPQGADTLEEAKAMSMERELSINKTATPAERGEPLYLGRYMTERSPVPLVAVEGATHLVRYVNPAFCRLAETREEDLIGNPFVLAVPESGENGCLALLDSVLHRGGAGNLADQKHRHSTSEPSYWSYVAWAILDASDRPAGVMIQVMDTTQQTLARQQTSLFSQTLLLSGLRQHEVLQQLRPHVPTVVPDPLSAVLEPSLLQATMRSFSVLANALQDHAVLLLDEWANIVEWSLGAERLFGYSLEEMLGRPLSQLYTSEEVAAGEVTREIQRAARDGHMSDDRWMRRKDGSRFFASGILTALTDTNGRGFVKILRDTTEQKEVQEYQERRQIQIAVLRERDRLTHALHGTLNQELTGIASQLDAARGALSAEPNEIESARGHVTRALNLARQGLAEVQKVVQVVRSPLLQNATLADALRRLVNETTTGAGVQVELRIKGMVHPLSAEVEEGLMRVGQEALTNALQHARASYIRITLASLPGAIELHVEDNGQGFDLLTLPESKSIGLQGIKHRMQRIGGSLAIESNRSRGTKMKAVVPL